MIKQSRKSTMARRVNTYIKTTKRKKYMLSKCPFKRKTEGKEKKRDLHQNELFNAKLFTIHPGGGHLLNPKIQEINLEILSN